MGVNRIGMVFSLTNFFLRIEFKPLGGCAGFPVNIFIAPSFLFVKEALSGAGPADSIIRILFPFGKIYPIPFDRGTKLEKFAF